VQRVELESRLHAANEQLLATEKRYALDKERMQVGTLCVINC
jgi:hypothetical protein